MAEALADHDLLCRTAVEAHGGRVVKMIGDGLHAVFDEPRAAISSALELQRGMSAIGVAYGIPFRMRCGLHVGASQLREGDYFGSAVNRAARIMGAAHGGQVLMSQAVVDLAEDRLPQGAGLLRLGRVRLRDLSDPEDVWQLLHDDLPRTFPALRSLDATPNNLPHQVTSFIGREKQMSEVKRLLERARLLMLTGSGGCGKTRLAIQVAAELLDTYVDGVWLTELASVSAGALVEQTVAAVLGLKEEPGRSLTQTLIEHLKSRHALLVLDNAEHLLGACAQLADALLRHCPKVVLLMTSREALGLSGEQTYRVPSLSMPDPKHDVTPERVAPYESVRLFIERAQLNLPQFAVTHENAPALASVCHRLDGIPLALELAAARVRSMSIQEIDRRLDQRFRLLTGGSRTALPRQRTLRALIDWSYDLLSEAEKSLLGRLSVFAGGWTLDAAEEVCAGNGVDRGAVFDLLTSLFDKSLAIAEERHAATRYRMLETVRQYARDRLLENAEEARWRTRHLAYFLRLAEDAEPRLMGPDQAIWLDLLETEHDNLRGALTWSSSADTDAAGGLRLAGATGRFWLVRGYFREGRGWLSGLLDLAREGQDQAARAKALHWAGDLARQQGDYPIARVLLEESVAIRRALGDRPGVAASVSNLGTVAHYQGDDDAALALYSEGLAIRRELNDQWGIAMSLNNLGTVAFHRGDYATVRSLNEESLAIFRKLGDRQNIAMALSNLGEMALERDDYSTAWTLLSESLEIGRELGDRMHIASALVSLGEVAYVRGDWPSARALHEESLALFRELGSRQGIASSLNSLGDAACAEDDYLAARVFYEESVAICRELDDRWGLAESLEGLADVAFGLSGPHRAACLWGSAQRLRDVVGFPLRRTERIRHDRRVAAARAAMGADAFDAAWRETEAMPMEQVLEYALHTPEA
jgi:predicted ATPase